MRIKTFEEFYVAELQELASVENQLGELLLEMAEAASSQALKDALAKQREQTLVHQERLEALYRDTAPKRSIPTKPCRRSRMKRGRWRRSSRETNCATLP